MLLRAHIVALVLALATAEEKSHPWPDSSSHWADVPFNSDSEWSSFGFRTPNNNENNKEPKPEIARYDYLDNKDVYSKDVYSPKESYGKSGGYNKDPYSKEVYNNRDVYNKESHYNKDPYRQSEFRGPSSFSKPNFNFGQGPKHEQPEFYSPPKPKFEAPKHSGPSSFPSHVFNAFRSQLDSGSSRPEFRPPSFPQRAPNFEQNNFESHFRAPHNNNDEFEGDHDFVPEHEFESADSNEFVPDSNDFDNLREFEPENLREFEADSGSDFGRHHGGSHEFYTEEEEQGAFFESNEQFEPSDFGGFKRKHSTNENEQFAANLDAKFANEDRFLEEAEKTDSAPVYRPKEQQRYSRPQVSNKKKRVQNKKKRVQQRVRPSHYEVHYEKEQYEEQPMLKTQKKKGEELKDKFALLGDFPDPSEFAEAKQVRRSGLDGPLVDMAEEEEKESVAMESKAEGIMRRSDFQEDSLDDSHYTLRLEENEAEEFERMIKMIMEEEAREERKARNIYDQKQVQDFKWAKNTNQ